MYIHGKASQDLLCVEKASLCANYGITICCPDISSPKVRYSTFATLIVTRHHEVRFRLHVDMFILTSLPDLFKAAMTLKSVGKALFLETKLFNGLRKVVVSS